MGNPRRGPAPCSSPGLEASPQRGGGPVPCCQGVVGPARAGPRARRVQGGGLGLLQRIGRCIAAAGADAARFGERWRGCPAGMLAAGAACWVVKPCSSLQRSFLCPSSHSAVPLALCRSLCRPGTHPGLSLNPTARIPIKTTSEQAVWLLVNQARFHNAIF